MAVNKQTVRRGLPTGSVMESFGRPEHCGFGEFAALPPELARMMEQFKSLKYPLNSKAELLKQLGGFTAPLFVGDMQVEAGSALMFFPATMFPVASPENFAEKLSEQYHHRSGKPEVQKMSSIEAQLLAKRFVRENAKMLQRTAQAIRWVAGEKSQTIDKDSEAFASRLLRENTELVNDIVDAFHNAGTLRAKTTEEAVAERNKRRGKPPAGPE